MGSRRRASYRSPGVTRSEQGAPVEISVPRISAYSGRLSKKDLCSLMKMFCKAALHVPVFSSSPTEVPTRGRRIVFKSKFLDFFDKVQLLSPSIFGGHDPVCHHRLVGVDLSVLESGFVMNHVRIGISFNGEQGHVVDLSIGGKCRQEKCGGIKRGSSGSDQRPLRLRSVLEFRPTLLDHSNSWTLSMVSPASRMIPPIVQAAEKLD